MDVLFIVFLSSLIIMLTATLVGSVCYWKRKGQTPRIPGFIVWAFVCGAVLSGFIWIMIIHPMIQQNRPNRTAALMRMAHEYLDKYKERNMDYPARLSDGIPSKLSFLLKDGWSNGYYYEHRVGAYILVSYGSDEKPDGIDYWDLRERNNFEDISGNFKADIVISDLGWHRVGGQ